MGRTGNLLWSAVTSVIAGMLFLVVGWFLIHNWQILQPSDPLGDSSNRARPFVAWLTGDAEQGGMLSGEWGLATFAGERPAIDIITEISVATVELLTVSTILIVVIGAGLGVLMAFLRMRYRADGLPRYFMVGLLSLPIVMVALYGLYQLGIVEGTAPLGGRCGATLSGGCPPLSERTEYIYLPVMSLLLPFVGAFALWIRQAILRMVAVNGDERSLTFGIGAGWGIIYGFPYLFVSLASSLVIIEIMFAFPGMGRLIFHSLMQQDVAVATGIAFMLIGYTGITYIVCRLVTLLLLFISKHREPEFIIVPHILMGIPANRANTAHPASVSARWIGIRVLRWIGFGIGILIVASTLFAIMNRSGMEMEQNLEARLLPPDSTYPYGTDDLGRDMQARFTAGVAVSMQLALTVAGTATLIGGIFGLILAILPGRAGNLINGFINQILSLWVLLPLWGLLILNSVLLIDVGLSAISDLLVIMLLPIPLAIVRAGIWQYQESTTKQKRKPIEQTGEDVDDSGDDTPATSQSVSRLLPLQYVVGTLVLSLGVLIIVTLLFEISGSFLGLLIQPPQVSLGNIFARAQQYFRQAPYIIVTGYSLITTILLGLWLVTEYMRSLTRLDS